MTNDPNRVAPDHRTHLPGPTTMRPRQPIAASVLSVLLGLSCFAASPAHAYRAGGGGDKPYNLEEYSTFSEYAGDTNRNQYRHVKIGQYILVRQEVETFRQGKTLTNVNQLIKSYNDIAAYRADSTRNTRLYANIGSEVYRVTELEARNTAGTLSNLNLPRPIQFQNVAVGHGARAGNYGSIAIGVDASAGNSVGSTAIGRRSTAAGPRSTALGENARASDRNATAVGQSSQAQKMFSTALGYRSNAEGVSSIAIGHSSHALKMSSIALGHSSYAGLDNSIAIGQSVIARGMNSIAIGQGAIARSTDSIALGRGAGTHATGTEGIAIGQGASATGTEGIAIGSRVQAGANEVVVGTPRHTTYKLPGLGKDVTSGTTKVVTVDSNGRLSTQSTATGTASSRGAALRGAAGLSSEVTAVSRTEAADYEKAPAIGSGPTAPATAEQRRVVVQDTNRDGSVRLRTLDFGDLSGMEQRLAGVDRRVTSLSERLNRATAMSSALSALPNVVPGDNRFFLGVGAGHYSSEQALAIGMSARVQSRVFVNAGVALASGDEVSVRGGVGVVW